MIRKVSVGVGGEGSFLGWPGPGWATGRKRTSGLACPRGSEAQTEGQGMKEAATRADCQCGLPGTLVLMRAGLGPEQQEVSCVEG